MNASIGNSQMPPERKLIMENIKVWKRKRRKRDARIERNTPQPLIVGGRK